MKFKKIYTIGNNKTSAFTLIEFLIAMAIFSIAIVAAVQIFVSAMENQSQILALNNLTSNTSYNLEYISRILRMAKKDINGECITAKSNFENPGDTSKIRFLDYHNQCHEFLLELEDGQIKEKKADDVISLTPDNLKVSNLKFNLIGETQTDDDQPKVTIVFEIETKEKKPQKISVQTTISQRDLDVKY